MRNDFTSFRYRYFVKISGSLVSMIKFTPKNQDCETIFRSGVAAILWKLADARESKRGTAGDSVTMRES